MRLHIKKIFLVNSEKHTFFTYFVQKVLGPVKILGQIYNDKGGKLIWGNRK